MTPIRVGYVGDWYALGTGFATVARNLLSRLARTGRFEIRQLAIGFHPVQAAATMPDSAEKLRWLNEITVAKHTWDIDFSHPGGIPSYEVVGEDPWGQDCLHDWIRRFQFDVVITNADLWMTAWLVRSRAFQDSLGPQFIYYQPIDGMVADGTLPHQIIKDEEGKLHRLSWQELMYRQHWTVLYGKWARDLYAGCLPEDVRDDALARTRVIPHGVDFRVFHPYPQAHARKSFGFPEKVQKGFVIGMVATNQSRKDWPGIARAVGEFMRRHEDVYFFPWTRFYPGKLDGWDLERLLPLHMPIERVIRFPDLESGKTIPHEILNHYYAALDVHVLWHHGEGCGLPHLEAQSAGIPALAVDYAGITDYFSHPWLRCRPQFGVTGVRNCIERPRGDRRQLLQKLERLYQDPEWRVRLGRCGVQYARKHWDWDTIADDWVDLILTAARAKEERCKSGNAKTVGECGLGGSTGESSSAQIAPRIRPYNDVALTKLPDAAAMLDAMRRVTERGRSR